MYAIFETGGKQYKVSQGDQIFVEKLEKQPGEEVSFDTVLCYNNDSEAIIGSPFVDGASVKCRVVKNAKSKKVVIFKFKAKKNYRNRQGHRQPYTKLEVIELAK